MRTHQHAIRKLSTKFPRLVLNVCFIGGCLHVLGCHALSVSKLFRIVHDGFCRTTNIKRASSLVCRIPREQLVHKVLLCKLNISVRLTKRLHQRDCHNTIVRKLTRVKTVDVRRLSPGRWIPSKQLVNDVWRAKCTTKRKVRFPNKVSREEHVDNVVQELTDRNNRLVTFIVLAKQNERSVGIHVNLTLSIVMCSRI
jgi:hypothetical protein